MKRPMIMATTLVATAIAAPAMATPECEELGAQAGEAAQEIKAGAHPADVQDQLQLDYAMPPAEAWQMVESVEDTLNMTQDRASPEDIGRTAAESCLNNGTRSDWATY